MFIRIYSGVIQRHRKENMGLKRVRETALKRLISKVTESVSCLFTSDEKMSGAVAAAAAAATEYNIL